MTFLELEVPDSKLVAELIKKFKSVEMQNKIKDIMTIIKNSVKNNDTIQTTTNSNKSSVDKQTSNNKKSSVNKQTSNNKKSSVNKQTSNKKSNVDKQTSNKSSQNIKNNVKIKKPRTMYMFFCMENRQKIKDSNPELSFGEVTKKLSILWNVNKNNKEYCKKYEKLVSDDKKRYDSEVCKNNLISNNSLSNNNNTYESNIVNCKVNYIRPKYNNLEEWMNDSNNYYIGRKGVVFINKKRFPYEPSIFANPYKIGKDGTREETIQKYKQYIVDKLNNNKKLVSELLSLKGKKLGCWCYPELCHGNILLDLIEEYSL